MHRPIIVSVVVATPVTVDEGGDDADHGEHEDDGQHPSVTNQSQQVGQDTWNEYYAQMHNIPLDNGGGIYGDCTQP